MKLQLLATSLAATFGLAASASAALIADLQAPVTIALRVTHDTEIKSRLIEGGQEFSNNFTTVRLTARDFLEQLIEEGKIVGPLTGWTLAVRCTTDEADQLDHKLYAIKAGQPGYAIDIDDARTLDFEQPYLASALRMRSVGGKIVSGRDTQKYSVSGTFNAPISPMNLFGVGETLLEIKPVSLGGIRDYVSIPTEVTMNLSGGFAASVENLVNAYIVQGSISYGQHKVTSLRVAPVAE
jgi:hypothetical protein